MATEDEQLPEGGDDDGLEYNFYIGLCLAVLSTIFIGSSFIFKKKALLKIKSKGSLRAGSGGYSYLREETWWAGFLFMGVGEAANFVAYAFAPASLVTSLGALSVLVSAVLAQRYLHENLNVLGKLGCVLCVLGSTIIVLHSPMHAEVDSIVLLLNNLTEMSFLAYVALVVATFVSVYYYLGPRYGQQNVLVYVLLCSAVGSLSVMACKGLGLAVKETLITGDNESEVWVACFFLLSVVVCIVIQMNYLNKALDLFNTAVVTPVYYVLFTVLVIVASTILFSEWENLSGSDILGNLCGFATIIIAVVLLNGFKDVEISYKSPQTCVRDKTREANLIRDASASLNSFVGCDDQPIVETHQGTYGAKVNFSV